MAIIESTSGAALAVDPGFAAARVSVRPPETTAWISVGGQTGALTSASFGSSNMFFSFRNMGANPVMIRRVGIGFVTTVAFTAAQMVSFGLFVARSFTVSDAGGTAIGLTGNNGKHRSSMGNLTSVDARLSTTTAVTAGTRTLDTNALAQIGAWSGGAGTTIAPALNNLFGHDPEDYPLVLAQNEGFNIQNLTTLGAGGTGIAFVNFELAEASAF